MFSCSLYFCRYGILIGNYCEFCGNQEKIQLGYEYKVRSLAYVKTENQLASNKRIVLATSPNMFLNYWSLKNLLLLYSWFERGSLVYWCVGWCVGMLIGWYVGWLVLRTQSNLWSNLGLFLQKHIEKAMQLNPTDPSACSLLARWCYEVSSVQYFSMLAYLYHTVETCIKEPKL